MSAMAKLGHMQKSALAVMLTAGSILVLFKVGQPRQKEPRAPAREAAVGPPVSARCQFSPGETAAFTIESAVRDVRGDEEDHLHAALSWQVVEQLSATRWRLRAAWSGVSHSQTLTLPEERVEGPLTDPFFVDVDASCRFVGFGFPI